MPEPYKSTCRYPLDWRPCKQQVGGMNEIYVLLRGISLGLLLGILLVVALRFWRFYPVRVLGLFCLCLCGYLLAPFLYSKHWSFYIAVAFSDASVLVFLLLSQALFADHSRPSHGAVLYGVIYLGGSYLHLLLNYGLGFETGWLRLAIRLAMLGGTLYAMMVVVRNWQQDLVESRRRLRLVVCIITGGYVLGVTLYESLAGETRAPLWLDIANSAGILISLLVFSTAAIILGTQGLLASAQERQPTHGSEVEAVSEAATFSTSDPELQRVFDAMEQRRVYRDMDLTIRGLSGHTSIAEHRLRRLINRELRYRNFNDFLNHYRLQEVDRRLADPGQARTPILTIAMDAGYRSMTTFNRAFRSAHGQTPTEYRRKHCAKS